MSEDLKKQKEELKAFKKRTSKLYYKFVTTLAGTTMTSILALMYPIRYGQYHLQKIVVPNSFFGLFEGSILAPGQMQVIDASTGRLSLESAVAGEYVAYDFNRPLDSRSQSRVFKGKLLSFDLDDIKESRKETLTPPKAFSLFDYEYVISFETPSLDYLLKNEFLEVTTYAQAFRKQDILDQYENEMCLKGITEKEVYQVTPKANTRLFVTPPGGIKKTKEKMVPEFSPAPV